MKDMAWVGESMAEVRVDEKLGVKIVERPGTEEESYMAQFLEEDGTIKSVKPVEKFVWRIYSTLAKLAGELTDMTSELSGTIMRLQGELDAVPGRIELATLAGYKNGRATGMLAVRRWLDEERRDIDIHARHAMAKGAVQHTLNRLQRRLEEDIEE